MCHLSRTTCSLFQTIDGSPSSPTVALDHSHPALYPFLQILLLDIGVVTIYMCSVVVVVRK